MKVKVYSRGETHIDADAEYQEPAIREAIEDGCNDVASAAADFQAGHSRPKTGTVQ